MADNVKDIVDLAIDDKPNKAGEAFDNIVKDRLADKVDQVKNELSNQMFGQEYQSDADPVEVQPELDLEVPEEEEDQEYQADQEQIEEPGDEELVDDDGEVEDDEQPEQEEDPVEDEEEDENT